MVERDGMASNHNFPSPNPAADGAGRADALLRGSWWSAIALGVAAFALLDSTARLLRISSSSKSLLGTGVWDRLFILNTDLQLTFVPLLLVSLLTSPPRGRRIAIIAVAVYVAAILLGAIGTQMVLGDPS